MGWAVIQYGCVPVRRGRAIRVQAHREKRPCEDTGPHGCLQATERGRRSQTCHGLDLRLQAPELWENKFLLFKCSVCGIWLEQTNAEYFLTFLENISGAHRWGLSGPLLSQAPLPWPMGTHSEHTDQEAGAQRKTTAVGSRKNGAEDGGFWWREMVLADEWSCGKFCWEAVDGRKHGNGNKKMEQILKTR